MCLGLAEGMFMVGWGVPGRVEGGGSLLRVGCAGMGKWCACNEFGVGMEIGREYAIIDWCGTWDTEH